MHAALLYTCVAPVRALALTLALAALPANEARAAPAYTLLDLGDFHAGGNSFAQDINNLGQVVGWADVTYNDPSVPNFARAFRTRPNQPLDRALDDLGAPDGVVSTAHSINDQGQVAGTYGPF